MIAGTTGSSLGKGKNINPGQCKISEPLLADFLSMCAFKEEEQERPYFCDINERNYRVQNNCVNYWHHVLYVIEGSNHVTAT